MTPSNNLRFSIIIPAYNEERYLPRLLDSIEVARSNYSGGPGAIEVIVADNDSTDRTAEVAAAHGARVVTVKKRRIAAARNGGGHAARGEIVCFIEVTQPYTRKPSMRSMGRLRVAAMLPDRPALRWNENPSACWSLIAWARRWCLSAGWMRALSSVAGKTLKQSAAMTKAVCMPKICCS